MRFLSNPSWNASLVLLPALFPLLFAHLLISISGELTNDAQATTLRFSTDRNALLIAIGHGALMVDPGALTRDQWLAGGVRAQDADPGIRDSVRAAGHFAGNPRSAGAPCSTRHPRA